jgi:hypothetical protein
MQGILHKLGKTLYLVASEAQGGGSGGAGAQQKVLQAQGKLSPLSALRKVTMGAMVEKRRPSQVCEKARKVAHANLLYWCNFKVEFP